MSTKAILDKNTNQCKGEWEKQLTLFILFIRSPTKLPYTATHKLRFQCGKHQLRIDDTWQHTIRPISVCWGTVLCFFFLHHQLINAQWFSQLAEKRLSTNSVTSVWNKWLVWATHNVHVFASCVLLCGKALRFYTVYILTMLTAILTMSFFNLSKWCTARVPWFCITVLWGWFQDRTLMILRVKQLLKARCLHCCHWPNQNGEHHTIATIRSRKPLWWTRLTRVSSDESLPDCWSGLNKALINMIVVVCFWRGTQEHVFSMIAAHLPKAVLKRYPDMVQDNSTGAL